MTRTRALASIGMALACAVITPAATLPAETSAPVAHQAFDQHHVWETFKIYCMDCHIGPKAPAGLNLQALDFDNLDRNGAVWEKLMVKLRNREMPPPGMPRQVNKRIYASAGEQQ